jgi:hypothetical protein
MSIVTRRRRGEFAARWHTGITLHIWLAVRWLLCLALLLWTTAMIKPKTGICEAGSEYPFVAAQEGRGTFTVVTHYSDAHACDQKLCTDLIAVEVLQTRRYKRK